MTRAHAEISPAAIADLTEQADWMRREAGHDTADRFLAAAQSTINALVETPRIGPAIVCADPALPDVRKWRVQGFARLLIFYRPTARGITVVRVLHTAQDWAELLDL